MNNSYSYDKFIIEILYEDDHIAILNKPSGLLTHKKNTHDDSPNLQSSLHNKFNIDDDEELKEGIVHRLDKDTSGILIFALNRKSAKYFSDLFSERKIEKIYEAIVIGEPKDNEGIFENHVEEDGKTYLAETKYKIIKRLPNDLTHIELRPTTGRKHQLRIHCKLNGLPILGDNKYYLPISKVYKNENNLLLHAKKIIFNDQNGVLVKVEAKLPKYFFNYI